MTEQQGQLQAWDREHGWHDVLEVTPEVTKRLEGITPEALERLEAILWDVREYFHDKFDAEILTWVDKGLNDIVATLK